MVKNKVLQFIRKNKWYISKFGDIRTSRLLKTQYVCSNFGYVGIPWGAFNKGVNNGNFGKKTTKEVIAKRHKTMLLRYGRKTNGPLKQTKETKRKMSNYWAKQRKILGTINHLKKVYYAEKKRRGIVAKIFHNNNWALAIKLLDKS